MAPTIELASYLFIRLRQLGIKKVHGLPGDYNLTLLDYVEPSGLEWSGNCNELNAGYAADGYARVKGVGALITTFGVGELSAVNAIAGSYAELVPVIHIVGTPSRADQKRRALVHHTMNDGNFDRFSQMYTHVTVAQVNLWDTRTSPTQIDTVLEQCLVQSRPVYIQVPADMVAAQVSSARLDMTISIPPAIPPHHEDLVLSRLLARFMTCQRPSILVDGESKSMNIWDEVQQFVTTTKWPTWTTAFGKGILDESAPNVRNIYSGGFGHAGEKRYFDSCDLVVNFGPHHSSTNSFFWTTIPKTEVTVAFSATTVQIDGETFQDLPAKHLLSKLLGRLNGSRLPEGPASLGSKADLAESLTPEPKSDATTITQKRFYARLQHLLNPGDIILGETGTAAYGVRNLTLPQHSRFFNPVTWLSIGYMLPAALGAGLAQREKILQGDFHGIGHARTVLFIGDGSVQISVQEISTIIQEKLDMIIFILNNDGYTIERCIHGRNQGYNDIAPWRYLQAPSLFGGDEGDGEHATYTFQVRNWNDLENTVNDPRLTTPKGLKIVEVFMDRLDAPAGLLPHLLEKQILKEQKS
ncbi:hypothetical protein NW767_015057 [Fusarium falciforme]|uniref:Pyruvate decarboxylase n=1 Tax=Fusarium falciforme TaxID=195108 RepID=A0A9W8US33_9HYPO|nr:hypothetical protein NW755_014283 [Fusarium falciforme]KAJ4177677.1 hypothetical protein NW767_015057 [Fusarium falciforme]KAJ4229777.1 hypothetical protein NW757_014021 [Fusarium falciforme]